MCVYVCAYVYMILCVHQIQLCMPATLCTFVSQCILYSLYIKEQGILCHEVLSDFVDTFEMHTNLTKSIMYTTK